MNKHTKIYAEVLEPTALAQFDSAMEQDFTVEGALMPDAHTGYSLPIGAVIATKDVVVPAWVGYDIGCGMCALKLEGINDLDIINNSKEIFERIYETIPVGFNINERAMKYSLDGLTDEGKSIADKKKWGRSLGSLGGGNHFIEIGNDEDFNVWVVIHSGSRGVGHGMAAHYMTLASSDPVKLRAEFDLANKDLLKFNPDQYDEYKAKYVAKKQGRLRPKEGHYGFNVNSQEGKDYIQDLNWCLDFALANRKEMMTRVVNAITEILDLSCFELDFSELINRNHNHAEERAGLWIHRKGATQAEKGMMGVIPGNMRDGSFIVRGKGNPESLFSSSHGAGRVMGRKEAQRKLNVEDFEETMKGIQAPVGEGTLDESPYVYKNIFNVMELQEELVEVVAHIKPIVNIKG
jgi:tRNA-splicing ligase RtcB